MNYCNKILLHEWSISRLGTKYIDSRSATVIGNWFLALSASDKEMVFSLMWFEWKLLHKWYFKVTKVIREYVGLKCARACCFWHRNQWLPNSQINLNLRKITRCCSFWSFSIQWNNYINLKSWDSRLCEMADEKYFLGLRTFEC